ncbi:MAG: type II toxin-antitoxin system RelE/ParE family toxin [Spirulina sp.]
MKVKYLPSFIKDLKSLKSSPSYRRIKTLVFEDLPSYDHLEQIPNLKKLKEEDNAYRIRVGDYRIGFFFEDDAITFARVRHRREIYRVFP